MPAPAALIRSDSKPAGKDSMTISFPCNSPQDSCLGGGDTNFRTCPADTKPDKSAWSASQTNVSRPTPLALSARNNPVGTPVPFCPPTITVAPDERSAMAGAQAVKSCGCIFLLMTGPCWRCSSASQGGRTEAKICWPRLNRGQHALPNRVCGLVLHWRHGRRGRRLLRNLSNHRLRGQGHGGDAGRVLQGRAGDLGGVNDATI